jgi:hypothetical protein
MQRKLFICLFLAGLAGFAAAQDTNSIITFTNTPDNSLAAQRARIEDWRQQFGGFTHVDFTNTLVDTNDPDGTNQLSLEERRARIRAALKEWHDRQSLAVYTNSITNLPVQTTPGTNIYYP